MATKKKLLNAAAGSAGGASSALNVEDLFSTYLYRGNNDNTKSQGINNGLALGALGHGSSTEFDGTAYAIRRTSALNNVGATHRQFTYSGWIQFKKDDISSWASLSFDGFYFLVYGNENQLQIVTRNDSNTNILYAEINGINPRLFNNGEWFHILMSFDLTNTSRRHIYINDVAQSVTYNVYTNDIIDFARTNISVGNRDDNGGYNLKHYQAHLFLDTTYRDLSQTSNRRIFIDANGGSTSISSLSALNPLIYLPMTDGYSVGENLGTGGDFSDNGGATINTELGTEYDADAAQGGMVWIKNRDDTTNNCIFDTERGVKKQLDPDATTQQETQNGGLTDFTGSGFVVANNNNVNNDNDFLVSWSWRKAPRFFDVVTFTGNGTTGTSSDTPQTISHNLGSVPGMIVVKKTSGTGSWITFHRSLGSGKYMALQTTNGALNDASEGGAWANYDPTDTDFKVGHYINDNGASYVAYLFAHNDGDGEFGVDQDLDIIKCGSYAGNGSTEGPEVNLGFEPQFLLIKRDGSEDWLIMDSTRTMPADYNTPNLRIASTTEYVNINFANLTSTGFKIPTDYAHVNASGSNYIYMAIRRPTKIPTTSKEVFSVSQGKAGNGYDGSPELQDLDLPFLTDMTIGGRRATGGAYQGTGYHSTRMVSGANLLCYSTNAENTGSGGFATYNKLMHDYRIGDIGGINDNGYTGHFYDWARAPHFFDVVQYRGNGTAGRTMPHNLGVVPEMMWIKRRNSVENWVVYHKAPGAGKFLRLNSNDSASTSSTRFNNTAPTSSVFTLGADNEVNSGGTTKYIAMLFATLDGVSKVGSFTGQSAAQNIECGFSNGAKFVLVKKYDASGGWYLWDSFRGIVAGSEDYYPFHSGGTAVTGTDLIDPYSGGFSVAAGGLASGNWLFYAIAE